MENNHLDGLTVGSGFDVHRLESGRRLMLGGVAVPHDKGTLGHSDGDPVIHAVIDALLGACGMGDIGDMFPDTDPNFKDISSKFLLAKVMEILGKRNCVPVNIDVTIFLERPKLGPHKASIRKSLSVLTGLPEEMVSVKAKTAEGLGPVGAGEAVECHATVLMRRK